MTDHLQEATRLHEYVKARHWRDGMLIGPDPGVRFNYRIWRFIKSAIGEDMWDDDLYYVQAQGYWILANVALFRRGQGDVYSEIATRCAQSLLSQQADDGSWVYPNPEWSGRIATAEGTWGALGLLELHRETGNADFLSAALRWHEYLIEKTGFQHVGDELAINYFANRGNARVPNNSAFVLRFLAELASLTGDSSYMEPAAGMVLFLKRTQQASGEFPYVAVETKGDRSDGRPHFQCTQYNAFQCMDLIRYYEITNDVNVREPIVNVLSFLTQRQGEDGHAFYQCGNTHRAVLYHTAALGAAFTAASSTGFGDFNPQAEHGYRFLLHHQDTDGGFPYSHADYRVLRDRRSYPRYLAMILYHLLVGSSISGSSSKEEDPEE